MVLFDIDERLARLRGLGDQLEAFSRAVDQFRPELERALSYSDGSKGGRPPFDRVLTFKILVHSPAQGHLDEPFLEHCVTTPEDVGYFSRAERTCSASMCGAPPRAANSSRPATCCAPIGHSI